MFSPLGCVIPVGPDFRDPDKAVNWPPYFTFQDPLFGTEVSLPQTFTVKVKEWNPLDHLFVRWVSDYPPYTQANSTIVGTRSDIVVGEGETPIVLGPVANCDDFADTGSDRHPLVVIVADRPFVPPEDAPNLALRYSAALDGTVAVVNGWTVICP